MNKLPKKILHISDLVFTLPDNFEGDISDAFKTIADYTSNKRKMMEIKEDNKSSVETLYENITTNSADSKLCMRYGIFECDENGNYILK